MALNSVQLYPAFTGDENPPTEKPGLWHLQVPLERPIPFLLRPRTETRGWARLAGSHRFLGSLSKAM